MLLEIETSRFRRTTKWHIRRVLKWIDPEDLKQLYAIRVIDDYDDPGYVSRKRYLNGILMNGHYEFKTKDRDPRVVLYANDIFFGLPGFMMYTPAATLKLARTLAHEIGHHVVATKGYLHNPWEKYGQGNAVIDPYEEKMVEDYAQHVLARMLRSWCYKFGQFLKEKFARLVHLVGHQKYLDGDYVSAARFGFCAYHLDHSRFDAYGVYWYAMEKLKTQSPSPLNEAERHWLLHGYAGSEDPRIRKWRRDQTIKRARRKGRKSKAR